MAPENSGNFGKLGERMAPKNSGNLGDKWHPKTLEILGNLWTEWHPKTREVSANLGGEVPPENSGNFGGELRPKIGMFRETWGTNGTRKLGKLERRMPLEQFRFNPDQDVCKPQVTSRHGVCSKAI